jgi:carbon monoxide dehydrogenase subunit G
MKIAGQSTLAAAAESIWPLIFDPRTLLELLPGCEQVEQVAPDEYRGRMTLRVPAIAGTYETWVKVLKYEAPSFCQIQGEATGSSGSVRGQASFTLQPDDQKSRIVYEGDAQIGGPLAGMNPRFAEGVAQMLIRQGLAKLPELAREREAAMQQMTPLAEPAASPGAVTRWARWLADRFAGLRRRLAYGTNRFLFRGRA